MTNLVDRLRNALRTRTWVNLPEDIAEAANEIERLRHGLDTVLRWSEPNSRTREIAEEHLMGRTHEPSADRGPELSHDSPDIQYADVFKAAEKGEWVNTQDLINALWWKIRNQRRELCKLNDQRNSALKSSGEWRLGPNTTNPHCHCVITGTFVDSSKCPVHGLPQRT